MKSRHTPIKGKLSRSFGFDGNEDLVVELNDSGQVLFRREPTDRKLKRGEKLPELRMDVAEVCADMSGPPEESDMVAILEALALRIPILKIADETPGNIPYGVKVWLIDNLKQIINDQKNG